MDPLALNKLDDKRIKQIMPLIPPQILMEDLPLTFQAAQSVILGRSNAESIMKGHDDRLLVIVGPCSVHDVPAALEYGKEKIYIYKERIDCIETNFIHVIL